MVAPSFAFFKHKKTEIVTMKFKNFATINLKNNVRMCNIELLCKNRSEVCYTSTLKQLANVKCKIRAKASLWLIPSINSASGLFINVEKFHIKQKWSENIGFLAKLNINFSARQTTVQYTLWKILQTLGNGNVVPYKLWLWGDLMTESSSRCKNCQNDNPRNFTCKIC